MFHVKHCIIAPFVIQYNKGGLFMPSWTPEQTAAIVARNHTILVSAAAGSGKTAVLVERILSLIHEGVRMNRMLIVTFTRAAAAEMRQRLSKRLTHEAATREPEMVQALDDLEGAQISTIHSFCQHVIRSHFELIGVDPLVRVCDEQQRKAMFRAAFTQSMDELLEEAENADFLLLADVWEQNTLLNMAEELYAFLMAIPKPFEWLERQIEQLSMPVQEQPWAKTRAQEALRQLEAMADDLESNRRWFRQPFAVEARWETWQQDMQDVAALQEKKTDLDALREAAENFTLSRMKAVRGLSEEEKAWSKRFTEGRTSLKDRAAEVAELLTLDEERLKKELPVVQQELRGLSALIQRLHQHFLQEKAAKNCMDFGDMEQFTLEILAHPEAQAQLQEEFDHIFVDECQDVSQVQDAILQAIHGERNCLFMVGDVKQSIYRFRKADPTLFLGRLQTFSDEEDAPERRILLQKNFRSRANVLNATNQVFGEVMRPNVTELSYGESEKLIAGRETVDDPLVQVHLVDQEAMKAVSNGEKDDALRVQTRIVAQEIKSLLGKPWQDGDTERRLSYRDIVILLSQTSNVAETIVEVLGEEGIPTYYDGAQSYYDLPEIRDMRALLSTLDNPKQDVPLLSVLKMPPFLLTDTELAQIRLAKTGQNVPFWEALRQFAEGDEPLSQKCRGIQEKLDEWRFEAEVMRLSDFIWHIMTDSGYYATVGALPKGDIRQANLRMLFERAQAFEQEGGETLAAFIQRMAEQQSGGDTLSARVLGENEDLVRLMTMHKSKGLEFPVVFLMNLERRLIRAQQSNLQLHPRLGAALPYVNRSLNIRRKTMLHDALGSQRNLDELAERARLLYVAMTRAKERLELVACVNERDRERWQSAMSDAAVREAGSMINWIMQAISTDTNTKSTTYPQAATLWNVRLWTEFPEKSVDKTAPCAAEEMPFLHLLGEEAPENLFRDQSPAEKRSNAVPLKTSVTALLREMRQKENRLLQPGEEDEDDKRTAMTETPLRLSDLPQRPAFLEEKQITAAERGTLTHRALSLLPLDTLKTTTNLQLDIQQAMQDMRSRGIFSAQEAAAIDLRTLTRYFSSPLGQRMLKSPLVRREWAFNLLTDEEKGMLLQGVIDCAFREDDGWVMVDYKTDRIDNEVSFIAQYTPQMLLYIRALQEITGEKVKDCFLYALRTGKAYPVIPVE